MNSQRLQPEQVLALAPKIAQFNVPMDEAQLAAFVASRPTVEQVKGFATQFLGAAGKSQEEIDSVLQVVYRLADQPTPEGVEVVEDVEAWKSKLVPAPYATPVAEVSARSSRTPESRR